MEIKSGSHNLLQELKRRNPNLHLGEEEWRLIADTMEGAVMQYDKLGRLTWLSVLFLSVSASLLVILWLFRHPVNIWVFSSSTLLLLWLMAGLIGPILWIMLLRLTGRI